MAKKTVLTYGTFDLFHVGHLRLLKRLKALGDHLIVAVSTDAFNAIKHKQVVIPYAERAEIVRSIRYVDEVIAEENWDQKIPDVKAHAVDVFAMGDDWQGKFDFLKPYCEVVYLPRTEGISSSELKQSMADPNLGTTG
jgi:glycerol-3-phosphate cytidylyltransferase